MESNNNLYEFPVAHKYLANATINSLPANDMPANKNSIIEDPEDDVANLFFNSKKELLKEKISWLVKNIKQRKRIFEDNTKKIDEDVCHCHNVVSEIGLTDSENRDKWDVELKQIMKLNQEIRNQEVQFFQDTQMLKNTLIDTLIEYKSLNEREVMLNLD